jgi:hypothetical protein
MILVIIIAAAWIVILAPSLMKRRSQSVGEIGSISHFHRQLRVLEHSGPQPIVTPAYRLRSVDGGGATTQAPGGPEAPAPVLSVVGASQLPRPALAFLGDDPGDGSGVQPGASQPGASQPGDWQPGHWPVGSPRERLVFDASAGQIGPRPALPVTAAGTGMPGRMGTTDARLLVRRRRRDTLTVMAAVFVVTLAIGFVPGASAAWVLTALSGVALAAYVALLVHLRRMAEERERKLRYLKPEGSVVSETGRAARAPITMSGRYAHPSNPAFAAR